MQHRATFAFPAPQLAAITSTHDARIQSDLAAGRLDKAINRALDDEKNGRVQPL